MNKHKASWLAKISVFSAKHINAGFIIWTIIIAFGLVCYLQLMKREGFPNVESPIGTVVATYPAGNKDTIDQKITKPVIDEVLKNQEVKKVSGVSGPNNSNVVIEYKEKADSAAQNSIIEKALKDKQVLPKGTELKFSKVSAGKFRSKYDVLLSVHSPSTNIENLIEKANLVSSELQKQLGTDRIEVIPQAINASTQSAKALLIRQGFDWYGYRSEETVVSDQSVLIGIQKPSDKDLIYFNDQLDAAIEKTNQASSEVKVSVAAAEAPQVESQIEMLQKNLLEAILIVSLVCLAFISIRAGIVSSVAMLATLTLSMIILYASGITLNTITLFALILCIGLIVDDTVIMIEAIEKYKSEFDSFLDVVKFSANRVARASLTGTFTTILGFAPLLFISGVLGDFIRILPITVIVSLLVSLLVSVTFVPFLARVIDSDKPKRKAGCNPFVCLEQKIAQSLHDLILRINTNKKKFSAVLIAASLGLLIIAFGVFKLSGLKFDIFPQTKNTNSLKISFVVPASASIQPALEKSKEINNVISQSIGEYIDSVSYYSSGDFFGGTVQIRLTPYEKRSLTSQQILEKLQSKLKKIKGADIYASQVDVGPPKDQYPFRVQINSTDPKKALQAAEKLNTFLQARTITRPNASTAKINKTNFDASPPIITRVNSKKVIEIKAGFDEADTSTLVNITKSDVQNYLKDESNRFGLSYDDFTFDFGSESSNQESFKGVLYALPLLLVAMYILLAIQFKGFIQPLLIFMAVPFSIPGVAIGLALTNNPISFFSVVGFFALIGISVNNTIMLVDFANQKRREGFGARESMAMAIKARTRPLLVTSTTAVVALIPLVLSDPFWESLAVTLMFGLISSTILVTTIFPYYYLAVEKFKGHRS